MNSKNDQKFVLSSELKSWIAENKSLQVPDEELIRILIDSGVEEQLAVAELQLASAHPYVHAMTALAQRMKKLECLLDVYRTLDLLSPDFGQVERRSSVSKEEFFQNYYCRNRPVIFTDLIGEWKAISNWTPEYLKNRYGTIEVEITVDRETDAYYEMNVEDHKRKILLGDFVDMVLTGGETNDYYMVANNHNLELDELSSLLADIQTCAPFLNSELSPDKAFLIFGPAGTITPLHHDTLNVLLAQVYGRKSVKLIPSNQLPLVYNNVGVFADVDCGRPDYDRYPLFRKATIIDLTLEAGEVLFIPVGWWHYVRAMDVSITINMDNFVFPNEFEFCEPEITRAKETDS